MTQHDSDATGLVIAAARAITPAPVPTYTPDQMIAALEQYRALQTALDQAMPDQIVTIADRHFRRRGYWRAIGVAFNLTVAPLEERREVQGTFQDGQPNFGYLVTYQATAPNGRRAIGDGACFAIEKAPRRTAAELWRALPAQATEHNIRSHAHTRGYNRAIANLVGFGETPAEEVDADAGPGASRVARRGRRGPPDAPPAPAMIDASQQRRLFERARAAGWTDDQALKAWFVEHGIGDTSRIAVDDYDAILDQLLIDRPGAAAGAE